MSSPADWRRAVATTFSRLPRKRLIPVLAALAITVVWVLPALAHHIPFFEIDGDTIAFNEPNNPPTSVTAEDWDSVILGGEPNWDAGPGILIRDPSSKATTDPNIFSPAGKFTDPANWTISSGTVGPGQNELTNIYVMPVLPGDTFRSGNPQETVTVDHAWMMLGMERTKSSGTFDLDFEINQVPWDGSSGTLVRTLGDLMVGFELKGNPTDPQKDLTVLIASYVGNGPTPNACSVTYKNNSIVSVVKGTDPCPEYGGGYVYRFLAPADVLGDFGEATMNATAFPAPAWGSVDDKGNPRTEIPAFQFAEAGIDLTEMGLKVGCPGFGSVHAKSRSSLEPGSDLKDLAGPVNLKIDCKVSGHKYEDMNANGDISEDTGNPLEGWTINLFLDKDNSGTVNTGDELVATTTTDASGHYEFDKLSDGNYLIQESCPTDWYQSYPDPTDGCGTGVHAVTVNLDNRLHENQDFGNFRNATKSGMKFEDLNGNGKKDSGEPGLANWTIKLDGTGGMGNAVDTSTQTGADGTYSFSVAPGTYTVSEELQSGWTQSYPADKVYNITLTSGQEDKDNDFGNFRNATKSGMKFEDLNGNGKKDDGEPGLANWTIKLDGTDGMGNAVNLSTSTAADGTYSFSVAPGKYTVSEVAQSGWTQSYPASGSYDITLTSGQEDKDNDFGNFRNATKSGYKFNDQNASGARDSGEPGLPNWPIKLVGTDGMGNAVNLSTTTDANGFYSFSVPPGTYTVSEQCPSGGGWVQTMPGPMTDEANCGNNVYNVTLTSGQVEKNNNFGNFLPPKEGCTPGFWQGGAGVTLWDQSNDPDWTAHGGKGSNPYTTTTQFGSFFTPSGTPVDKMTMLDIVGSGGTSDWVLKTARDVVAAYLNASFGMQYPETAQQVADDWTAAINYWKQNGGDTTKLEALHNKLAAYNQLGCNIK